MEHGDPLAKPGAEPAYGLGGQGDLRHQHNGRASRRKGLGNGLQIDLRLAAARYAVEQKGTAPRLHAL